MTRLSRKRTWDILETAAAGDRISRVFDVFLVALIMLNVVAVVVGSVEHIQSRFASALDVFEFLSVAVFTAEYFARLWSCASDPRYSSGVRGRLRYFLTPMAIVDLVAILPFYLTVFALDLRAVRLLRLLRILRLAKLGRYSDAMTLIARVISSKREELVLSLAFLGALLVLSSSLMYFFESAAQPESFPNIPATMWWSVVTLTTVGYGDVYPVTVAGKLFAALISIIGVGMVALPAGILGSGFVEEIGRRRSPVVCPHCGHDLTALQGPAGADAVGGKRPNGTHVSGRME